MSIKNFSNVQFVKSVDTGEEVRCGRFQLQSSGELGAVRNLVYVQGTLAGTERMRTKFYSDANHTKLLYTSDWSPYLTSALTGDWIGFLKTEYNKENINASLSYYIGVEFDGYTRNGETFYIGVCRDFPYPIYKITPTPLWFYQHPLATQVFAWIER